MRDEVVEGVIETSPGDRERASSGDRFWKSQIKQRKTGTEDATMGFEEKHGDGPAHGRHLIPM